MPKIDYTHRGKASVKKSLRTISRGPVKDSLDRTAVRFNHAKSSNRHRLSIVRVGKDHHDSSTNTDTL